MNHKAKIYVAKYAVYVIGLVALYVMQTTPEFLTLYGIKPNLVAAAAVCIAMHEGEFIGGIYGAVAGVLCDLGAPTLFGFHAVILLVACVLVGLSFIYLLRATILNFTMAAAGVLLGMGLIDFLLNYAMWGYADVSVVLTRSILPTVVFSTAVSPLLFYLYRRIYRIFEEKLQD